VYLAQHVGAIGAIYSAGKDVRSEMGAIPPQVEGCQPFCPIGIDAKQGQPPACHILGTSRFIIDD